MFEDTYSIHFLIKALLKSVSIPINANAFEIKCGVLGPQFFTTRYQGTFGIMFNTNHWKKAGQQLTISVILVKGPGRARGLSASQTLSV